MARVCEYICDELSYGMVARQEEQECCVSTKVGNDCNMKIDMIMIYLSIYRCVNENTAFIKDERTKMRVSFPSYKVVYEAGCEDIIFCKTDSRMGEGAEKRDVERRRCGWLV